MVTSPSELVYFSYASIRARLNHVRGYNDAIYACLPWFFLELPRGPRKGHIYRLFAQQRASCSVSSSYTNNNFQLVDNACLITFRRSSVFAKEAQAGPKSRTHGQKIARTIGFHVRLNSSAIATRWFVEDVQATIPDVSLKPK